MLTERDTAGSNVTLVNEALAKKYFAGVDPVGKRIKFGRPTDKDEAWITVVGVVADEKQDGLSHTTKPEVYVPYPENVQNPATFVVRSHIDAEATISAARLTAHGLDRDLLLTDVTTLDDLVRDSMRDERFRTTLLGGFAGIALFLAAVGIYGVLAYFVSQRSRELGIRLALGAHPHTLFLMVVGQGLRPVAAGAGVGLTLAVAVTGLMKSMLFGVEAADPATYAATAAVLAAIAAAACTLPALRATRVDPLVALRDE